MVPLNNDRGDGLIKTVFYIPENYNDSTPIPADRFRELDDFLYSEFGGYSVIGKVEGVWKNQETGEVARERSSKYEVALKEANIGILRGFLIEFKKRIKQDKIYFEIDKDTVVELL
jgi:hypothetical protein